MADDPQRDQGGRAAPGALQPLGERQPAASFERLVAGTVAGILFALRREEPDQPGFRVAESDAGL